MEVIEKNKQAAKQVYKRQNRFLEIMGRLVQNRVSVLGMILLGLLILTVVFAPVVAPYDPTYMDFANAYGTPCLAHPFGCDPYGRDMLSRLIYGGRYSLFLGFSASMLASVLGVFFGTIIGYCGGKVDMVAMRICDVISAIPGTLLAVLVSTALGPGYINTIIAMAIGGVPGGTRSSRAMCLKEREREYLEAAVSINCSPMKIMFTHIAPNIISPTIIGFTMGIGNSIMNAASLSYIGLGVQPPTPEWGAMLSAGRDYISTYPHLLLFPGLVIMFTILCVNMFGDGLRDALDPKLKR